jgi:uncharacterized protein (TIGR02453 family)
MSTTRFEGFPKEGQAFFAELAFRQDRDWFKAHKADYERLWETPMQAFMEALKAKLAGPFPDTKKATPRYFRIYRDVRFSKDKTPYKTSISAALSLFGGGALHEMSGLYCEFGKEPFIAMGRWMMEPPVLLKYRKAVASDATGKPLGALVQKALKQGYELGSHEVLQRVPKGFDPEHPRAELLKRKGLALSFPALTPKELASPKLVDVVAKQAAALAPVMKVLEAALR